MGRSIVKALIALIALALAEEEGTVSKLFSRWLSSSGPRGLDDSMVAKQAGSVAALRTGSLRLPVRSTYQPRDCRSWARRKLQPTPPPGPERSVEEILFGTKVEPGNVDPKTGDRVPGPGLTASHGRGTMELDWHHLECAMEYLHEEVYYIGFDKHRPKFDVLAKQARTAKVEVVDVEGRTVIISLAGQFHRPRKHVLQRVERFLQTRIPDIEAVVVANPSMLEDS
eukprot:gnl/TRDRNA2_/TRDRNA2_81012_c0_seq1.p1 gnl/TRDRNA2_/TRDRNA2_81012_c0~~gnl/TRDRNA2_/TRDRNA2_81012_c0_seq1.p1  ORF type:complete len:226 (+),score=22.62 gnl/TRDRNA2_/TRDRNA2_81012_c0_seq1:48-725(+)